ncbi:TPA: hypothetical protein JRS25_004839 [Escherichia coli]|nr:hypothetical protein [Escherichia coli]
MSLILKICTVIVNNGIMFMYHLKDRYTQENNKGAYKIIQDSGGNMEELEVHFSYLRFKNRN